MKSIFSLLVFLAVYFPLTASGEEPQCDGVVSILRLSNYVEGGSEAGLREASRLHNEWYVANGVTENSQAVIPILDYDRAADSVTKNSVRVATLHLNSTASRAASKQQDNDDWKKFISVYNANTEVTETIFLCIPNNLLVE